MKHFRRLGIWKPDPGLSFNYPDDHYYIRSSFVQFVGVAVIEDISVRGSFFHKRMEQLVGGRCNQNGQPKICFAEEYPTTFWHRDGDLLDDGTPDGDEWQELLMWSNRRPTEICLPNGRIVHGKSCEVIAFRNSTCLHRTPLLRESDRNRRNFIRALVRSDKTFLS